MPLVPCERCSCHYAADAATCPHCGERSTRATSAALLLGLTLMSGCFNQNLQPLYGVTITRDPPTGEETSTTADTSDTGTER